MTEQLSFEDAVVPEGKVQLSYMAVGNHKVKVIEVVGGLSSQKQSPYVRITVENENKEKCTQDYYVNGGAWNISKSAILTIITAALAVDEATAKSKLVGVTTDNIAGKLATLLIGKTFAITLNGEWVTPTDINKKPFIKSVFGSYLFAVPTADFDKLSKKPYVKGNAPVEAQATTAASAKTSNW